MIVSYGGELTFYLDDNDSTIDDELSVSNEDRLDIIADNLDTIIPKYYLMELTQARQENGYLSL